MAWDHWFYDEDSRSFPIQQFIDRGRKWYGGDDVIGLWPTWPALGMDERNQWDHFRDLPGGLDGLNKMVGELHNQGIRFFICYNPWDESTRLEDHLEGMAGLIQETDADGVVLDTRGSSSYAIQKAADSIRNGVIMYSEGMAVPKDMPGIVSGRVHNALYYPPMLNLNKLIKPDFAIFRVAELKYERIRREYNLCLFNGYGVEINMFSPGQPEWIEEDYRHLGRIARILRENSSNFLSDEYTPLIKSLKDSIYINYWPGENKDVYTLYSMITEGVDDPVLSITPDEDRHIVDLWNHEEVKTEGGKVTVKMDAFHKSWLGTNNEGATSAIAVFPNILEAEINNHVLLISTSAGDRIEIWKGNPDYEKSPVILDPGNHQLSLRSIFPRFEGKIIIQLKEGSDLLDERILSIQPGTPILISETETTRLVSKRPPGMVEIPAGEFQWVTNQGDTFISYPPNDTLEIHQMKSFFMDSFPVTNQQFRLFLDDSGYQPSNSKNFLKDWKDGDIPDGEENFPVVFVSHEDAKAYASWAGKRLPTELEWQYAAQTKNQLQWPWGDELDSTLTNTGDGNPYRVGKYPEGQNPFGLQDLVGNVWQMTADIYESGSYTFNILKGGSYFKPMSSWWYVQGGPQPLAHRQIMLMVSAGFDRKGTVGFRCMVDKK